MNVVITSFFDSKNHKLGGVAVYQQNIVSYMRDLGINVIEYYYPRIYTSIYGKYFRLVSMPFCILHGCMLSKSKWFWHSLTHQVSFFEPFYMQLYYLKNSIVNAQDIISAFALSKMNVNIPWIVTFHSLWVEEMKKRYNLSDYEVSVFRRFEKLVFTQAHKVVAVSESRKQYLMEHYHLEEDRVVVIYPGIDTKRFTMVAENRKREIRRKYGIPVDRIVVSFISRFSYEKGISFLVEAIEQIKEGDFHFVFVGEGKEREKIDSLVRYRRDVSVLGAISNSLVHEVYALSDVFVLPSIDVGGGVEGLPISLLEAMASGNIVVATSVGGIREVVVNNYNGILIEPGSVDSILKAILRVKSNFEDLSYMRVNARRTVEQYYSIDFHVRSLLDLYSSVMKG